MSVENHRHCQATVLGATGSPAGAGTTWDRIDTLDLPKLEEGWKDYFATNKNVTEDLAGILQLINWLAGKVAILEARNQTPIAGDLITVTNERKVNVKNNINNGWTGLVGIEGISVLFGPCCTPPPNPPPTPIRNTYC